MSEVLQVPIAHQPVIAKPRGPIGSMCPLPLKGEVPPQRNGPAPNFRSDRHVVVSNGYGIGQVDLDEPESQVLEGSVVAVSVGRWGYGVFSRVCHAFREGVDVDEVGVDGGFSVSPERQADYCVVVVRKILFDPLDFDFCWVFFVDGIVHEEDFFSGGRRGFYGIKIIINPIPKRA